MRNLFGSARLEGLHEWTEDMLCLGGDRRSTECTCGAMGTSDVVCIETVDELNFATIALELSLLAFQLKFGEFPRDIGRFTGGIEEV